KQTTIGITGMTCSACSNRIEKVLNKMPNVDAKVNLATEKATITYNEHETTTEKLVERIEKLGYGVVNEKVTLDIQGMTCSACSNRVEKVLNKQTGINRAMVNLAS